MCSYCALCCCQSIGETKPENIQNMELILAELVASLIVFNNQDCERWIKDSEKTVGNYFAI